MAGRQSQSEYPNSGIVFQNDEKENENQPDWRGHAEVDGKPYWVAMWEKRGQKGPFMTFSFQPKEERTVTPRSTSRSDRGRGRSF